MLVDSEKSLIMKLTMTVLSKVPALKKWKIEGGMLDEIYADFRKQRAASRDIDNFEGILYYKDKKTILSAGEVVVMSGPHYWSIRPTQ